MSTPITFLEFCGVAKIVYHPAIAISPGGFVQYSPTDRRLSGFQGAIYRRFGEGGFDWVVGIAGTQPKEGLGADLVADAGFGGATGGVAGGAASLLLGPLGALGAAGSAALSTAGMILLEQQCRAAGELVEGARRVMGQGDRLYVTGHSLGGGICQIVAARYGVPAVCFNPPSVTAVGGVEFAYARTKPAITSLQVRNDPINHTGKIGRWLGKIVPLPTARTGGDAHSIDLTHGELGPSGPFTAIGASDPFI